MSAVGIPPVASDERLRSAAPLLVADGLRFAFGSRVALDGLSFSVGAG